MDGITTLNDSVLNQDMIETAHRMFMDNKLSSPEQNDVPVGMYV